MRPTERPYLNAADIKAPATDVPGTAGPAAPGPQGAGRDAFTPTAQPPHGRAERRSIRDVARHAGVSVGTVSHVLNHPETVAAATRERVHSAITELGFVRDGSARQLRAGLSTMVGALVLDVANPFFTEVARGIEDRLAVDECLLILCSSDDSAERERHYLAALEEQRVRGLLVTPATDDLSSLRRMSQRGTPVVLLDRAGGRGEMCSVAVDDTRGGQLAAEHLLSLGHRRIGLLGAPPSIRQWSDRRAGVRDAVASAGHSPDTTLVEVTMDSLNARGGEAATATLLSLASPTTALLCVNDLAALGALRCLLRRGISVPGDISIVGYDDVEFAAVLATPLTSVRQPKYDLGRAAADLLLADATAGPGHAHQDLVFRPELVVRESTAPAATSRD